MEEISAHDCFRELRSSMEIDLMALQNWKQRETNEEVVRILDKRIRAANKTLITITSTKTEATLKLLEEGSQHNEDILIQALLDLKNWDEGMIEKYESMDMRINEALNLYWQGGKV